MKKPASGTLISTTAFATRARTIDHLGREQIADCPTAVSELWKNSWDAYAHEVRLRVFNEEAPVAALTDDGHGMTSLDLMERWLTIGTESKLSDATPTPADDRNGLEIRPRQGQKGIGRLSSAKLGSILLLISKHRNDKFVAALVDWRMFENPYLNLSDIAVPTGIFASKADVFKALPALVDAVVSGVVEAPTGWRESEVSLLDPWKRYDQDWALESIFPTGLKPSARVLQGLKRLPFREDHLADWTGPGTAMLVFDLDDTLRALPSSGDTNLVKEEIDDNFQRTLSNFVDPYSISLKKPSFGYRADVASSEAGKQSIKTIVGAEKAIDRTQIQDMEHQIEGSVGVDGIFRGRIKAFGTWVDEKVEFELPKGLTIPERANTRVGSFDIYIAAMEFMPDNSTHPRSEFDRYLALAEDYSGLMIYRNSLRVLPYGREDNDFFSIEFKRSKNAGRYFWNHRQMFGRIALTRAENANLKDKAGREGFIDNLAAKTFRAIVGNILDLSARRYFGSASAIRKPRLKEIKAANLAGRAEEEAKKLRARERKQFGLELERAEASLPVLRDEIENEIPDLKIIRDSDVSELTDRLSKWRSDLAGSALRPQPEGTARLKPRYEAARANNDAVLTAITSYEVKLKSELERYSAESPEQIVAEQVRSAIRAITSQIDGFQSQIEELQREQYASVRALTQTRIEEFRKEADALGESQKTKRRTLLEVTEELSILRDDWIAENRTVFGIYVSALETVRDQIDLETLASIQTQDLREKATELDRLTTLAQLGIAVEIAAHDLADFDEMASAGLTALPQELRDSEAVRDIRLGVEGLTDQLRFLSPLRLSGDKVQRFIEGHEIEKFVQRFFAPTLAKAGVTFSASEAFRSARLYERPARVFPVFLNLVNNSIYWVGTVPRVGRSIVLDVVGDEIVISDSGPGVANEDLDQIFRLFFTRKQRSGRGVGLYLARANLAAGGHSIRYKTAEDDAPLEGATFYIRFRDIDLQGDRDE